MQLYLQNNRLLANILSTITHEYKKISIYVYVKISTYLCSYIHAISATKLEIQPTVYTLEIKSNSLLLCVVLFPFQNKPDDEGNT